MNHTVVNEITDTGKRNAGNDCWSSEWSFIEDADVVIQKSIRSSVAGNQMLAHCNDASPNSS